MALENPYSPEQLDSAVAVVGMACKFAGADSLEEFWHILETGSVLCRDLPYDRFPDWRFERRAYPKSFKCNVVNDIDAFDHKFFGISSREATFMDPQQRLALQVTYQALESSGYFSTTDTERERDIGCYMATCMNEYHENVACHPPSAFSLTGSIRPFIAGKVSHYFGWSGPAMMFDTACAASGTAIHQACRAVATGECKSAVAGATNIFISPDTFQNLAAGQFISRTGASKSFDATADGYCRGEGVAVVVLKKLSEAVTDGDAIAGLILSTVIGQNAHKSSITVPHAPSQMGLYQKALRLAGIRAEDVSYVEAHGTGTRVGDPIELESIRGVFRDKTRMFRRTMTYMGSLKSNIGHTEAASGISGLIKVLLMMHKSMIPRQALFESLSPATSPLEPDGIQIPTENVLWSSEKKIACVNNYGASGSNAVMMVAQPPTKTFQVPNQQVSSCPVSIRAFSPQALVSYCSVLLEWIAHLDRDDLTTSIAYHLSRQQNVNLPYSLCATVSSHQELRELLDTATVRQPEAFEGEIRPVILFFGGQTGKLVGLPRALYESSQIFRKHIHECDSVLQQLGHRSILPAIFEPDQAGDTILSHSILFAGQYASAKTWLECGLRPTRLLGHSFGQLTALCVSGALLLEDTLRFITERARLIRDLWGKDPGSMVAIEAKPERLYDLLGQNTQHNLDIACYNGPKSFVLAGGTSSIDRLEKWLQSCAEQIRWKTIAVPNSFHSSLTEPLLEPLQELARTLDIREVQIPLETCSKDETWQQITPKLIASHIRDPVFFHQAVSRISEQNGPCTWIEAGSGTGLPILRRALGEEINDHTILALNWESSFPVKCLADMTKALWNSGLNVKFWHFHQSQQHEYEKLYLPPYQFEKSRHWLEWQGPTAPALNSGRHTAGAQMSLLSLVRRSKDQGEFQINIQDTSVKGQLLQDPIVEDYVCPIAFLLKLAATAVERVLHDAEKDIMNYNIESMAIRSLTPVSSFQAKILKVSKLESWKLWAFTITDSSDSSLVYADGTVSAPRTSCTKELDRFARLVDVAHLKRLSSSENADSIKGKAVYRSLPNIVAIAKSRQMVREVSAIENEAIGVLTLNSDVSFVNIEIVLQVPFLCLNILRDNPGDTIYLNTSVGKIAPGNHFASISGRDTLWTVYVRFHEAEASTAMCDVFVFDEACGKLCASVLDVRFVRVQNTSSRDLAQNNVDNTRSPSSRDLSLEGLAIHPGSLASQVRDSASVSTAHISDPSANSSKQANALFGVLIRTADVDSDVLCNDTLIADLGVDSLMIMEIVDEINKFFSICLTTSEVTEAIDLGSLCDLVTQKTSNKRDNEYQDSRS